MRASFFLDSNVLLYAFAPHEPHKQQVARSLCETPGAWLSTQVLSEIGNVLTKRFRVPHVEVRARIASLANACEVVTVTPALILEALRIADRYRLGFYDSQILAAALACGVPHLYSEDLQHGQKIEGLEIRSPFASMLHEKRSPYVSSPKPRRKRAH